MDTDTQFVVLEKVTNVLFLQIKKITINICLLLDSQCFQSNVQ